jgi:hypothetical protein
MNGMKNIWENPERWSANSLKQNIRQRLNDMYLQKYHNYMFTKENSSKCNISKICVEDEYKPRKYLQLIKSPSVRANITKLRIDCNNTLDCKFRSFRYRSTVSDICTECGECDTVSHMLLRCNKRDISKARKLFFESYLQYVKDFNTLSEEQQIRQILCVKPKCAKNDKDKAIYIICKFVKNIYNVKQG